MERELMMNNELNSVPEKCLLRSKDINKYSCSDCANALCTQRVAELQERNTLWDEMVEKEDVQKQYISDVADKYEDDK
jgi:hypothetical protein